MRIEGNIGISSLFGLVVFLAAWSHTAWSRAETAGESADFQTPRILSDPESGILMPPQDRAEPEGTWVSLEVRHTLPKASYRWFKDGAAIPGADGRILNIGKLLPQDAGLYSVVLSNSTRAVSTPAAKVTVLPASTGTILAFGSRLDPTLRRYAMLPINLMPAATSGVVQLGEEEFAVKTNGWVIALSPKQTNWESAFRELGTPVRQASARYVVLQNGSLRELAVTNPSPSVSKQVLQMTSPPAESVASFEYRDQNVLRLDRNGTVHGIRSSLDSLRSIPAGLEEVVAISLGETFAAALRIDGTVVTWGTDDSGISAVPSEAQGRITAIAAGRYHLLAMTSDGRVFAWGSNLYKQCEVPVSVGISTAMIVANGDHSAAVLRDGSIVLWGGWPPSTRLALDALNSSVLSMWASDEFGSTGRLQVLIQDGPPRFMRQPMSASPRWLDRHELDTLVSGSHMVFQWWKDGQILPAETNRTLVLDAIRSANSGVFRVQVSNRLGSVWSDPAVIRPMLPPTGRVVAWGPNGNFVPQLVSCGVIQVAAGNDFSAALLADGRVVWWNRDATTVKTTPDGIYHRSISIAANAREPNRVRIPNKYDPPGRPEAVYFAPGGPATLYSDGSVGRGIRDPMGQSYILNIPGRRFVKIAASEYFTFGALDNGMAVLLKNKEIQPLPLTLSADVVDVAVPYPSLHEFHPGDLYALLGSGDLVHTYSSVAPWDRMSHRIVATGVRKFSVGAGAVAVVRENGQLTVNGGIPPPDWGKAEVLDVSLGVFQNLALVGVEAPVVLSDVSSGIPVGTPFHLAVGSSTCGKSVQWWKDGIPIPGGTNDVLRIRSASPGDGGSYAVVVDGHLSNSIATPIRIAPPRPGTLVMWGGLDPLNVTERGQARTLPGTMLGNVIGLALPAFALNENGEILSITNRQKIGLETQSIAWSDTEKAAVRISGNEILWIHHANRSLSAWSVPESGWVAPPLGWETGAAHIASGQNVACAATDEGTVSCFGKPLIFDQREHVYRFSKQRKVPLEASAEVFTAVCDSVRIAVLKKDGSVLSWNPDAASDDGIPPLATNVPPAARTGVRALAAGANYFVAIRTNNEFVIWGDFPQVLANPPPKATTDIVEIAAGKKHILTLNMNGEVFAWGDDTHGQTSIPAPAKTNVSAIFACGNESAAILGYPVALKIHREGDTLSISWPAHGHQFDLQTRSDSSPSMAEWHSVTDLPERLNGRYTVRLRPSPTTGYFRLVRGIR